MLTYLACTHIIISHDDINYPALRGSESKITINRNLLTPFKNNGMEIYTYTPYIQDKLSQHAALLCDMRLIIMSTCTIIMLR